MPSLGKRFLPKNEFKHSHSSTCQCSQLIRSKKNTYMRFRKIIEHIEKKNVFLVYKWIAFHTKNTKDYVKVNRIRDKENGIYKSLR